MGKLRMDTGKKWYPAHCTECGEEIENRFFFLDDILKQYSNGQGSSEKMNRILKMLGVGALYGQVVLPEVAPLRTSQKEGIQKPDLQALRSAQGNLNCFAYEDSRTPPREQMKPVNLNIAAIVAQFFLMSDFAEIYDMLETARALDAAQNKLDDTGEAEDRENRDRLKKILDDYCDQFGNLTCIQLSAMSTTTAHRSEIRQVLTYILEFADLEAAAPGKRNFAAETMMLGWRYREINDRRMPIALVAVGETSGKEYYCGTGCCDKCHRPVHASMGAYEQRIIGLLGTQAAGKTTYLAALADAITNGEATSVVSGNGTLLTTKLSIMDNMADDPQWIRARREPGSDGAKAGFMWLYGNGFPPEKTDAKTQNDAPALTFMVKTGGENPGEPVMYTLADIAGEAFTNHLLPPGEQLPETLVRKLKKLLKSSDMLIMVVSSRQLADGAKNPDEQKDKMIQSPGMVLSGLQGFMPSHFLPTAVVLTAADEINHGDLRRPMNLAYDAGRCPPLVYSDRARALVFNAEAMENTSRAVGEYIDKEFGQFMNNLTKLLGQSDKTRMAGLAAFAVSSGTQCAPYTYLDAVKQIKEQENREARSTEPVEKETASVDRNYLGDARRKARYEQMKAKRFGVTAPLLWLLAREGKLEIGRGDNIYNNYPEKTQREIQAKLKDRL